VNVGGSILARTYFFCLKYFFFHHETSETGRQREAFQKDREHERKRKQKSEREIRREREREKKRTKE
jgi:hypothetical protein